MTLHLVRGISLWASGRQNIWQQTAQKRVLSYIFLDYRGSGTRARRPRPRAKALLISQVRRWSCQGIPPRAYVPTWTGQGAGDEGEG